MKFVLITKELYKRNQAYGKGVPQKSQYRNSSKHPHSLTHMAFSEFIKCIETSNYKKNYVLKFISEKHILRCSQMSIIKGNFYHEL